MSVPLNTKYDFCTHCGDMVIFTGNVCVDENNQIDAFCCDSCRKFSFYEGDKLIGEEEYERIHPTDDNGCPL